MAKGSLLASASNKEELEKMINEYYLSTNYIIDEHNNIFNTKKQSILDGVKVVLNKGRWRFERV